MSETLQAPIVSQVLALIASVLLVFVSVIVVYLSAVEWKDRRRRRSSGPN